MSELGESTAISNFKEPVGGGKRDRTPCADGNHSWECNTTSCADCWDPACEPNRAKEQQAYDDAHEAEKRNPQERKDGYENSIREQLAAGKDPVGLNFESAVLATLDPSDIEYYSYAAHCTRCHVRAEIDFVTKSSVMECKFSAKGFDLDQMKTRVQSIAKACFSGKKVVCVTRASQLDKLKGKLRQWKKRLDDPLEVLGI